MPKRRLKLRELISILGRYGVACNKSRGKGGHVLFTKTVKGANYSYPVPGNREVLDCYVRGARKKFKLTPQDGIDDDSFYGK